MKKLKYLTEYLLETPQEPSHRSDMLSYAIICCWIRSGANAGPISRREINVVHCAHEYGSYQTIFTQLSILTKIL